MFEERDPVKQSANQRVMPCPLEQQKKDCGATALGLFGWQLSKWQGEKRKDVGQKKSTSSRLFPFPVSGNKNAQKHNGPSLMI